MKISTKFEIVIFGLYILFLWKYEVIMKKYKNFDEIMKILRNYNKIINFQEF